MEAALMDRIMQKEDPNVVAKDWIKQNPEWLDTWLAGVTTFDGKSGIEAVKKHLSL
jgi:glycine betaine/proline transport system substrate-binding protein